jgi:uncharacterized protein YmfQ (DUF2313 family)
VTLSAPLASLLGGADEYLVRAYAFMLRGLFPPGRLWDWAEESPLWQLMLACADGLGRLHERGVDLLREVDPTMTQELLPEWEAALGLASSGGDLVRLARVVARLIHRQRVRPADFQRALAGLLGLEIDDVEVIEMTRAQAVTSLHPRDIYLAHIWTGAGPDYDLSGAQALVDQIKHAHTEVRVFETKIMIVDDPKSLVDRDLIGA